MSCYIYSGRGQSVLPARPGAAGWRDATSCHPMAAPSGSSIPAKALAKAERRSYQIMNQKKVWSKRALTRKIL